MKKTIPEKIIEGAMVIIGIAEASHLSAVVLKLPFSVCAGMMAVLFLCAVIVTFLWCVFKKKKAEQEKNAWEKVSLFRLLQVYPLLFGAIGLLVLLQIVTLKM